MKIIKQQLKKTLHYTVQHQEKEYSVIREDKGLDINWHVINDNGEVLEEGSELWEALTDFCWEN